MAVIRPAEERDLPALIDMGERFHRAALLGGVFCPGVFAQFCSHLMREDEGCVFVSPIGMIGGHISPGFWDATYKIANEAFWWAEDGHGLALVKAYEEWAQPRADEVRMAFLIHMRPVATGKVLSRLGYEGTEMGMVKT